jgi:hypothetical protein
VLAPVGFSTPVIVESSFVGIRHRRYAMRVRILLQLTDDDGSAGAAEEIATFAKATERPEDLGLSIAEGKALLAAVQHRTVVAQVAEWSKRHRCCATCGERRRVKGSYPTTFHTLYGDVELNSPRLHRCACQGVDGPATMSPLRALLPQHVAPERLYLEARWASLIPYAAAAGLLADILPITSVAAVHEALRTAAILGWAGAAAPGADGLGLPSLRLQAVLDTDLMAPWNVQAVLIDKPRTFAEA